MQRFIILFAFLSVSLSVTAQNSPAIFQVTTAATLPGDAVLIRGENIDKITRLELGRLPDEKVDYGTPQYVVVPEADQLPDPHGIGISTGTRMVAVEKVQQNAQSVKFLVPADMQEGVYSVRWTDAGGRSGGFYVNVPLVNWAISEEGFNAGAGGEVLRIQGKNLLRRRGEGQVVLMSGSKVVRLNVDSVYDNYSVRVILPVGLAKGSYQLYYHNGQGGKTAWSMPITLRIVDKEVWKTGTYSVKDFGAKGDGVHDETGPFKSAIAAAQQRGGGIVGVPAGKYLLKDGLVLPPYVILKGQGVKQTQIVWDVPVAPQSLVMGVHHFGLTDMSIQIKKAVGIVMSTGPVDQQGHVVLEDLVVRQEDGDDIDAKWNKAGIIVRGPGLRVRDCEFNTAGMFSFVAVSGFVQRCRFERAGKSEKAYMLVHPKGLIFEDCFKQVNGYGYGATIDESHDLYEARNVIPFNYINDREVMTLDGGSGGYFGHISSVSGNSITLHPAGKTFQWTPNKWIGGGVFIIDGKGTGQFRRIVSHTTDKIILDQPFLVAPDTSTVISITTIREHLFFVNNDVSDGGAYQFYGSAQECVVDGLKIKKSAGIVARGSYVNYGKQPNWYIDIVNCTLSEGTYTPVQGQNDRFRGFQQINIIGSGGAGLNIGTLVRRNQLTGQSYIKVSPGGEANDVQDAIIEDNKISGTQSGISMYGVGRVISNLFIHNNHFSGVGKQVDVTGGLRTEAFQVK